MGLTQHEVEQRMKEGKINRFENPNDITILKILKNNICTYFNLIIGSLALLIALVGAYKNLTFVGAALGNLAIGIIQEIRAKITMDRLEIVAARKIEVLRDNTLQKIDIEEIVLDDLIVLDNGDQIVCDCTLEKGHLEVNESLLTGEADVISKNIGDPLYSGSFVVAGKAYGKVIHVGKDNLSSQIILKAKKTKKQKSVLQENIDAILKLVSWMIIPLGCLLFANHFLIEKADFASSVVGTVAGIIGLIPEGLVLLTSVSLALGVIALANEKTLVHHIYSIETMAHVDTLCLDKTGTLTKGSMQLEKIISLSNKNINDQLASFIHFSTDNNATMVALKDYFKAIKPFSTYQQFIPFSSEKKYSGAINENGTLLMGAVEMLFPNSQDELKHSIHQYMNEGMRVLVVATSAQVMKEQIPEDLTPACLLLLSDSVRENAKETLNYFKKQGVDIKIISGDAPQTVSQIAKKAGVDHYDQFIDASKLKTAEDIASAIQNYTIFGRVSPSQKKDLIKALQRQVHVVGMTGDGVNDVMALKQADFSIAMASGSEAAKEVANVVLLDSDFSHLPAILGEGRKVIHHIQNAASLFLVKTIFSFLLILLTLITTSQYPFEPIQLTFIGSAAIGIPSFLLTLERDYSLVKGSFLANVLHKALPGAMSVFTFVCVNGIYCKIMSHPHEILSTMSVLSTTACILVVLKKVYPLSSLYRKVVYYGVFILSIICLVFFHTFFEMVILDSTSFLMTFISVILAYPIYQMYTKLAELVIKKWIRE